MIDKNEIKENIVNVTRVDNVRNNQSNSKSNINFTASLKCLIREGIFSDDVFIKELVDKVASIGDKDDIVAISDEIERYGKRFFRIINLDYFKKGETFSESKGPDFLYLEVKGPGGLTDNDRDTFVGINQRLSENGFKNLILKSLEDYNPNRKLSGVCIGP